MDGELSAPTLRALRRILRASDRGSRSLAAATGLTPSQLLVLQEVAQRDGTTGGVLATTLQFGAATITNIIDRLEAAGLVRRQRSADDKRQVILTATQAGREAIASAPDLLQTRFNEGFAALPLWERALILAALEKLAGLLGAESIDAAPLLDAGVIDRGASD